MFTAELTKMVGEFHYKHGGVEGTFQDFGSIQELKALDMRELEFLVKKQWDLDKFERVELDQDDVRLEYVCLETAEGDVARDYEIAQWKRGELELYHATYSIWIFEVNHKQVDPVNFIQAKAV